MSKFVELDPTERNLITDFLNIYSGITDISESIIFKIEEKNVALIKFHTEPLSKREFSIILDALPSFKQVRSLIITDCKGMDLSDILRSLQKLESIFVSKGSINNFSGLNQNNNLTHLSFTNMNLASLENILTWHKNLIGLVISQDSFTCIPECIEDLHSLEYLVLPDNPNLSSLPDSIGNLKNLQILDVSNCPIHNFPNSIGKCENLHKIRLNGCPIYDLPESMENLRLTHFSMDTPFMTVLPRGIRFDPLSRDEINLKKIPLRSLYGITYEMIHYAQYEKTNLTLKGKNLERHCREDEDRKLIVYYKKHPSELAVAFAADPASLTEDEQERLAWEGGEKERKVLENSPLIPRDHFILKEISDRLKISVNDHNLINVHNYLQSIIDLSFPNISKGDFWISLNLPKLKEINTQIHKSLEICRNRRKINTQLNRNQELVLYCLIKSPEIEDSDLANLLELTELKLKSIKRNLHLQHFYQTVNIPILNRLTFGKKKILAEISKTSSILEATLLSEIIYFFRFHEIKCFFSWDRILEIYFDIPQKLCQMELENKTFEGDQHRSSEKFHQKSEQILLALIEDPMKPIKHIGRNSNIQLTRQTVKKMTKRMRDHGIYKRMNIPNYNKLNIMIPEAREMDLNPIQNIM